MIEHALDYAAKGWPVFPCDPQTKAPHAVLGRSGGFHHATLDVDQLRQWWGEAPDALIGSAASFAIDIDTPEGIEAAKHLGLSTGAIVRTGNGWHAHFGPITRLKPKGVVEGLTIRPINKAYTIMPPSVHPSGVRYRWVGREAAPRLAELPRLPEAALEVIAPPLERLREPRRIRPAGGGEVTAGMREHVDRVLAELRTTPEGSRHPKAVEVAVHLAKIEAEHRLPEGTFRAEVEEAAIAAGLEPEEVRGGGHQSGLVPWAWAKAAA